MGMKIPIAPTIRLIVPTIKNSTRVIPSLGSAGNLAN